MQSFASLIILARCLAWIADFLQVYHAYKIQKLSTENIFTQVLYLMSSILFIAYGSLSVKINGASINDVELSIVTGCIGLFCGVSILYFNFKSETINRRYNYSLITNQEL